jgi:hypothetical protein
MVGHLFQFGYSNQMDWLIDVYSWMKELLMPWYYYYGLDNLGNDIL